MTKLMNKYGTRDDGIVIDNNFAGKLCGIADDTPVTNNTVVSNVHTLHEQVVGTYFCCPFRSCSPANGYVLTYGIVVANFTSGFFSAKFQILRFRGNAGTGKKFIAVAYSGSGMNTHIVKQVVVIAYYDVAVNVAERTNNVALANLCIRVYKC